jgi:hypothetical protein
MPEKNHSEKIVAAEPSKQGEVEGKKLNPEEQREQARLRNILENLLWGENFSNAKEIIDMSKRRGIFLDESSIVQKTVENNFGQGYYNRAMAIINFAEKNEIPLDLTKENVAAAIEVWHKQNS